MQPAWPSRLQNLAVARQRFGDRIDRLAPYLLVGDPLADEAIRAMAGRPEGYAWISRGAAAGGTAIPEAPEAVRVLVDSVREVPVWVDWAAVDRGGALLSRAGLIGGLVLCAKSLVYGYAAPAGNKPLVFSGRLRAQASRRLDETARFVREVIRAGGMRPGAAGFQCTLHVRLLHASLRQEMLASDRWDTASWGLPINQHDMAATTLLFSVATLDGLRQFGLDVSPNEGEDYMHLWRYVGHVIGVAPELLPTTEREAYRLADLIFCTQGPPDEDSRELMRSLTEWGRERGSPASRARLPRHLLHGICRTLIGDDLADQLGVDRSPWTLAVRATRIGVGLAERVRRRATPVDRLARIAGERYWDEVLRITTSATHHGEASAHSQHATGGARPLESV